MILVNDLLTFFDLFVDLRGEKLRENMELKVLLSEDEKEEKESSCQKVRENDSWETLKVCNLTEDPNQVPGEKMVIREKSTEIWRYIIITDFHLGIWFWGGTRGLRT